MFLSSQVTVILYVGKQIKAITMEIGKKVSFFEDEQNPSYSCSIVYT